MSNNTALVNAYTKYRQKRAEVKTRQKAELERELQPWASDVGLEIQAARAAGASVADIGNMIGVQNRTLIYDMIRAYTGAEPRAVKVTYKPVTVTPTPTPTTEPDDTEKPYQLEFYSGVVRVIFSADESYDVPVIDGVPDMPDEWAEHSAERRALYKLIVTEMRDNLDKVS